MDDLRVTPRLVIPAADLELRFSRSGGPGGQNVNRRDTRVELLFDVGASSALSQRQRERVLTKLAGRIDAAGRLRVVADEERTQARNRAVAAERMRALLAEALKPDPRPRVKTKPGRAAVERRLTEKRVRSRVKRERTQPDWD